MKTKMTVEELGKEALELRKQNTDFTYFQLNHLKYSITDRFPDIPSNAWILAAWFYSAYIHDAYEKVNGHMTISGIVVISRLSMFHIRSPSTVTKLFQRLADDGFISIKHFPNPRKASGHDVGYMPTELMRELCVYDYTLGKQNRECLQDTSLDSIEDLPPEPEAISLSDELFDFYTLLSKSTSTYSHHKPPTNEAPTKMWQKVDAYIHELMEGTFYTNHKDSFDKKAEAKGEIPKMTLGNIVEVCSRALNPCGKDKKPNIDSLFLLYKSSSVYTSPFLNYVWASAPRPMPKYTDEQIIELQEKYPAVKEHLSQVALDKAKIKCDNPYIYIIMDKVMDLFDDDTRENLKKHNIRAPTKGDMMFFPDWCIRAFNKYKADRKNPKWLTWEDWVRDLKVDDRKMWTPWFWTLHYIRGGGSNGKFILTEDSAIRTKIDDMIAHPYENKYDD